MGGPGLKVPGSSEDLRGIPQLSSRGWEQLPGEAVKEKKWQGCTHRGGQPGLGEVTAGADREGQMVQDGSASGPEGASSGWREKLGVSLFRARGERVVSRQGIVCSERMPWPCPL